MSSTSSSECECDNNYHYNAGVYGRTPFYPTMGQPLIYYAQVPQKSRRRQSRGRNDNCFVKAFRWYTQEHVPYNKKADMSFAAWLDSKYAEFAKDGPLDQNIYHLRVKQTSIIEADRNPYTTCCENRAKRFRVKSPWRRKRRASSNEAGDTIQKPSCSFEFILQPKDLSHPTSEYCQQSNATMQSTEITRPTIKSQSYTCCAQEVHTENAKPKNMREHERKPETLVNTTEYIDVKSIKMNESVLKNKVELLNSSCQCSGTEVVKIDAQTQCDKSAKKVVVMPDTSSQPSENNISEPNKRDLKPVISKEVLRNIPVERIICKCSENTTMKVDAVNEYQTDKVESTLSVNPKLNVSLCPCERGEEESKIDTTNVPAPVPFSNNSVQTSNQSIRLEKDAAHGYPLFMKIVCADKLCK